MYLSDSQTLEHGTGLLVTITARQEKLEEEKKKMRRGPPPTKLCEYESLPEDDVKSPGLSPAHPGEGVVVLGALLLEPKQQGGKS